jgi:hypothetical protein
VLDRNKILYQPDIELENHSRYKESYYKLMQTVPKPFNKKMGYFTYFTEKTKADNDMKKALIESLVSPLKDLQEEILSNVQRILPMSPSGRSPRDLKAMRSPTKKVS